MRRAKLVLVLSAAAAVVLGLLGLFYALTPVVALRGRVSFQGTPTYTPGTFSLPDGSLQIPDESFIMAPDGSLANVLVYLEDAPASNDGWPEPPFRVVKQNCLYRPRVFGIRAGQPIGFRNEDPRAHSVTCKHPKRNPGFNLGMVTGAEDTRTFENEEIPPVELRCDLHPWERAYFGVFDHPFFAVTGPDGTFAFPEKFRPGIYTIVAWHERLGTILKQVVSFRPRQTIELAFEAPERP